MDARPHTPKAGGMKLPLEFRAGRKYPFCDWSLVEPGYGMPFWQRYQKVHGTRPWLTPMGVELRTYRLDPGQPIAGIEPTGQVGGYSTLLSDGGKLRLWHETYGHEATCDLKTKICLIESDDGHEWTRPELGLIEYGGTSRNNIVFGFGKPENGGWTGGHGATIFLDESAPPGERYKMVFLGRNPPEDEFIAAVYGAVSPDGASWNLIGRPLLKALSDTQNVCAKTPEGYRLYLRGWTPSGVAGGGGRRAVLVSVAEEFRDFSEPMEILDPPARWGPLRDIYTTAWQKWPGTDLELMLPTLYDRDTDTTEIHIAVSRDGYTWDFPTDEPLLGGRRETGTQTVYAGVGIVQTGEMEWGIPVHVSEKAHNEYMMRKRTIAVARIREDGFTALEADLEGSFSLFPALFEGEEIKLNALTRPGGSIRARLLTLDRDGGPTPEDGYDYGDCEPLSGDIRWRSINWKGKNIGQAPKKHYRLEFEIIRGRIHSFRIE